MITTTKAMHTAVSDLTDKELLQAWDYCDKAAAHAVEIGARERMTVLNGRLSALAAEISKRNLSDSEIG